MKIELDHNFNRLVVETFNGQRSANVYILPSNGHVEMWMSAKNVLWIWVYEQYNPCEVHEFSIPWTYTGGHKGIFNQAELKHSVGSVLVNIGENSGCVEVHMTELNTLCIYVHDSTGEIIHEWMEGWGKV